MFKLFILVLALAAVNGSVLTPEDKAKFKAIHDACLKESGVDKSVLENVIKMKTFPDNDKLKKQVACVCQSLNVVSDDGKIEEDTLKYLINSRVQKFSEALIKNCGISKGSTEETAWELTKCLYKFIPKQAELNELALNFIASSN